MLEKNDGRIKSSSERIIRGKLNEKEMLNHELKNFLEWQVRWKSLNGCLRCEEIENVPKQDDGDNKEKEKKNDD